jgi:hypothetical protein
VSASFNPTTGNAKITEIESLVRCAPSDVHDPTSTDCTSFIPTGVSIKRVTLITVAGRVQKVFDTYSSTDSKAHTIDALYEDDLNAPTAGWELPGQTSFAQHSTGDVGPAPQAPVGSAYAIYATGQAPSLTNAVGAMTFIGPYSSVRFDNTLWANYGSGQESALFHYRRAVPAKGSTSITWGYSTGASLSSVRHDADSVVRPGISISSPRGGATERTASTVVRGTARAGSGLKKVTVNGITATVTGGTFRATVPLRKGENTITATLTSVAGDSAHVAVTVSRSS